MRAGCLMKNLVLTRLNQLNIEHKIYYHEPLFTVDQAVAMSSLILGAQCKNLFLKDSKNNFYLLVAVHNTEIMLKKLSKFLKAPELRFADAQLLKQYLSVEPGSVTPFGLVSDSEQKITVILDANLFSYDLVGFHPLENTATLVLAPDDLKKFVELCGNRHMIVNFSSIECNK
jgi:Ala-tRNA(Pro) deacylase